MLKDFRAFLTRGNVLELAVAVIIGIAFGAVITSLVDDVLMPVIGVLLGGVEFTGLSIQVGQASINYGNFIQAIVNFLIIAFVIFLIVRSAERLQKQKDAAPVEPANEEKLLVQIRDLLELILKR
jgi:large conductance mechanosensitive channel